MSFWSSVWETAESIATNVTTPSKPSVSGSNGPVPSTPPSQSASTSVGGAQSAIQSVPPKTPGAIFEEGWASLSSSFLEVITSTPSKLAPSVTTPNTAEATLALPSDAKKDETKFLSQKTSSTALTVAPADVSLPIYSSSAPGETHDAHPGPPNIQQEPLDEKQTFLALDASFDDPLSATTIDSPSIPGHSPITPHHTDDLLSNAERALHSTEQNISPLSPDNDPVSPSLPTKSHLLVPDELPSQTADFGDWDSDPFTQDSTIEPFNAPQPAISHSSSVFNDPWGDDEDEDKPTDEQEDDETSKQISSSLSTLLEPASPSKLPLQHQDLSSEDYLPPTSEQSSQNEDFSDRASVSSDGPVSPPPSEIVDQGTHFEEQEPEILPTSHEILEIPSDASSSSTSSSELPLPSLSDGTAIHEPIQEAESGVIAAVEPIDDEPQKMSSSLEEPLVHAIGDSELVVEVPDTPVSEDGPHEDDPKPDSSNLDDTSPIAPTVPSEDLQVDPVTFTHDVDIETYPLPSHPELQHEPTSSTLETDCEDSLPSSVAHIPSETPIEQLESAPTEVMEEEKFILSVSPSDPSPSLVSQKQESPSYELETVNVVKLPTPKLQEPIIPDASVSVPSPDVRHLQSKLDVLKRVLEERERQLATRSSVMAELQNENEKLKSDLDAFKSAQQRASRASTSSVSMVEALQSEFSERISTMETKFRAALKERDSNAEQLQATKIQLNNTSTLLENATIELTALKRKFSSGAFESTSASVSPPLDPNTSLSTSVGVVAPVPSTPSRLILGNVFSSSPFGTPSSSNASLVDSAISSISLLLSPAPDADASNGERQISRVSSTSSLSAPLGPSASSGSLSGLEMVSSGRIGGSSVVEGSEREMSVSASSPVPDQSLVAQLREEGAMLQERVQKYEGVVRAVKGREKQNLAEISRNLAKISELEVALKESVERRSLLEREVERSGEGSKKLKSLVESQKEALEAKTKGFSEKVRECEAFEREAVSCKSELESSWRMVESLKREVELMRKEGEEKVNEISEKLRTQNLENVSLLGAKSYQQTEALQKTIFELREALSGNRTLRSANEEVLERRIAELEGQFNHSEHLLSIAQQTSDLAQAPLLKHIADLQSQLAHQQRSIEALEEGWKQRSQNLEHSLSERTHDLTHTQTQLRIAEQSNHKLQAQYNKLELQYQTLSLEHDQLIQESSSQDSLADELAQSKANQHNLESQLASSTASKELLSKNHNLAISQLNQQVQTLQARIASLTTPGLSPLFNDPNHALPTPQTPSKIHSTQIAVSTPSSSASPPLLAPSTSLPPTPTNSMHHSSSKSHIQQQHASTALEAQIQKLKLEKSRLEDILANSMQSASLSDERERKNKSLLLDMDQLQERLDAALELVAEQSERLQFVDEEVSETKQLYKDEISNLVSQLQLAQVQIKDLEQLLKART